ncbi:hypothetical protein [Methylocaldum sp.]|uniref:hypothetical protein n=1 Tax=Methylocaldum sp. TaxID=1969727 RepID=UPI002D332291|nr:hypothetical protein [Methylocaldum sp.]HYE33963.1 hypothetical protein [Methylocaldum sp.]
MRTLDIAPVAEERILAATIDLFHEPGDPAGQRNMLWTAIFFEFQKRTKRMNNDSKKKDSEQCPL